MARSIKQMSPVESVTLCGLFVVLCLKLNCLVAPTEKEQMDLYCKGESVSKSRSLSSCHAKLSFFVK